MSCCSRPGNWWRSGGPGLQGDPNAPQKDPLFRPHQTLGDELLEVVRIEEEHLVGECEA